MKVSIPSKWILNLLFFLPQIANAQQINQEPRHAGFQVEAERETILQLESVDPAGALFQAEFQFIQGGSEKQMFLRFEGFLNSFDLWINNFRFGAAEGGGFPVEFNVTPFMEQGQNRVLIEFGSKNEGLNEQITDEMADPSCALLSLVERDAVHIRDVQVTDYDQPGSAGSLARVHLWLKSYQTGRNTGRVVTMSIKSPSGEIVANGTRELDFPLSFRQEIEVIFDETITDPLYWSPVEPAMYLLEIELVEKGNNKGEQITTAFGLGDVFQADSVLITGSDTLQAVIAEMNFTERLCQMADEEILDVIAKKNYNVVPSNGPLPSRVLDIFDKTGIVVIRNPEQVQRDAFTSEFNHPSVIWKE